jgi:hypothetical protein
MTLKKMAALVGSLELSDSACPRSPSPKASLSEVPLRKSLSEVPLRKYPARYFAESEVTVVVTRPIILNGTSAVNSQTK